MMSMTSSSKSSFHPSAATRLRSAVIKLPIARPIFPGEWYVHQNLRDDRAEAFATLLPAGRYEYTYLARATTPGAFVVPSARAEEMYHPESFGRAGTGRVFVE